MNSMVITPAKREPQLDEMGFPCMTYGADPVTYGMRNNQRDGGMMIRSYFI